jgi:hypothetical protein
VLSSLLVFRIFNWYTVKYFKFLEQKQSIEAIAILLGNRIAREIKDDEFIEAGEALDLIGVIDFIVSDVELHKTT